MSQQIVIALFQNRRALSYQLTLAVGAMLASLLVVAYAAAVSTDSAVRAHIVLQGAEVILLTLAAGIIAGAVHRLSMLGEPALLGLRAAPAPSGAAA